MNGRRALIVVAVVTAALLALPHVALADVTKTSNGNKLTVLTVLSGTDQTGTWTRCGGRNQKPDGPAPDFLLVSYICQWRDGSGNWHDFFTAPATDCGAGCRDTGVFYTNKIYPCNYLPAGNWRIRAQADGLWRDGSGQRHEFVGTVVTSGMTVTVRQPPNC